MSKNTYYFHENRRVELTCGYSNYNHLPFTGAQLFDEAYEVEIFPVTEDKYAIRTFCGTNLITAGIYLHNVEKVNPIFSKHSYALDYPVASTLYLYAEDHKNPIEYLVISYTTYINRWNEVVWTKRHRPRKTFHFFTADLEEEIWPWNNAELTKRFEKIIRKISEVILTQPENDFQIPVAYFLHYIKNQGEEANTRLFITLIDQLNRYIKKYNPTADSKVLHFNQLDNVDAHEKFLVHAPHYNPVYIKHVLYHHFKQTNYIDQLIPEFESAKIFQTKIIHAYTSYNGFATSGTLQPMGIFDVYFEELQGKQRYSVQITHEVDGIKTTLCQGQFRYKAHEAFCTTQPEYYHRYELEEMAIASNFPVQQIYLKHEKHSDNKFYQIILKHNNQPLSYHLYPKQYYLHSLQLFLAIDYINLILTYFLTKIKQQPKAKKHTISISDFFEKTKEKCPVYPYPEYGIKYFIDQINQQAQTLKIIPSNQKILNYNQKNQTYDTLFTTKWTTQKRLEECLLYFGN